MTYEIPLGIGRLLLPLICSGILLAGILVFLYLYLRTRDSIYIGMVFSAFSAFLFVLGEGLLLVTGGVLHDASLGQQVHRLAQIAAALFLIAIPVLLGEILGLGGAWRAANRVIIITCGLIVIAIAAVAFIEPDLFISVTVHKKSWLINEGDHGRGREGPVYLARDILLALVALYAIASIIVDLVRYRNRKLLIPILIGAILAIYCAADDIINIHAGFHIGLFPRTDYSRFALGIVLFNCFAMGALIQQFIDLAKETDQAREMAYREIAERERIEGALRASEELYRLIAENINDGIILMDVNRSPVYASPSIERRRGYTFEELRDIPMDRLLAPGSLQAFDEAMGGEFSPARLAAGSRPAPVTLELECYRKDGGTAWNEVTIAAIAGTVPGILWVSRDITERKQAERERERLREQLHQVQKLDAIGVLAGGIAHDFNNLLTAIIGNASIARSMMDPADERRPHVDQVLAASQRASELTRQLLAFSRKQVMSAKQADLNGIIRDIEKLLRRIIGEDIDLKINPAAGPLPIMADPGQIDQVIMNLAANARDAMPDGGTIIITTGVITVDDRYNPDGCFDEPGTYACVSVSDTGRGMDDETRDRIFEPFFTTKEVGRGTGLGLSIVFGIVKQHRGAIDVYSTPGIGTTIRVFIPLATAAVETKAPEAASRAMEGSETILLVEDDPDVSRIIAMVLGQSGYRVIAAADGEEGWNLFELEKDAIDLVLSDIILPKRNGKELHDMIKASRPDMKMIFMSGYTADLIQIRGILEGNFHFIPKPFMPDDILNKIRSVLDAG